MTADATPNRAPLNWPAIIMFLISTIPVVTVLPWYWATFGFDGFEWVCFFVLWALNGMSITAGYHRLWAHRSYEASKPLQIFYMLFGAMALQNSILVWASSHRVHHRHVDDVDQDPYSAKRGLWFSHLGWMLRNYESGKQDFRNAKDLEANPIVAFQHKYYVPIAVAMNFAIPLLLGWMHGNIWGSLLLGGFLRLVVSHHCTFFINSLAHFWGSRPYTTENTARDNGILALFTWGEGYHNYHHLFQWDYRNGIRWYQWDPTKWLISAAKFVGLARSLKRVPEFQIRQALVERQLRKAEENLGQCQDHGRLATLRQSLEAEAQHFKETLAHWATLQQKKVEAARKAVIDHIEHTEFAHRVRELEESLRQQYLRVRLIAVQAVDQQKRRLRAPFLFVDPLHLIRLRGVDSMCRVLCEVTHMATNLSIDPELIEQALKVSGEKTKAATVTKALQEFIARRRQKAMLDLAGKLEWDGEYDYKKERTRR